MINNTYNRFALIVFKIVLIEAALFFVLALHVAKIIHLPDGIIQAIGIPTFVFLIGDWWMPFVLLPLSIAGYYQARKNNEKGRGLSIVGMVLSFMPWIAAIIILGASYNT